MEANKDNYRFYYTDSKDWIIKEFTFEECLNSEPFDVLCDAPLLRDYKLVHRSQSTGLHDKNGVEIFEGDVVTWGFGNAVVMWKTMAWYDDANDDDDFITGWWVEDCQVDDNCEIIGNVQQNPELRDEE